jgi:metal-dependent amidase/aminoacylase/carboxypeptidase family protein
MTTPQHRPDDSVGDLLERSMKSAEPWMIDIRRDIHAHPERHRHHEDRA